MADDIHKAMERSAKADKLRDSAKEDVKVAQELMSIVGTIVHRRLGSGSLRETTAQARTFLDDANRKLDEALAVDPYGANRWEPPKERKP